MVFQQKFHIAHEILKSKDEISDKLLYEKLLLAWESKECFNVLISSDCNSHVREPTTPKKYAISRPHKYINSNELCFSILQKLTASRLLKCQKSDIHRTKGLPTHPVVLYP